MEIASSTKRFDLLDGLRGVAALAVVFHHLTQNTSRPLFEYAFLAVDVFFILSGFVIMHSYGQKLANGLPPPAYIYRRIQRLYPMFLSGLLLGLPLVIVLTINGNTSYTPLHLAASFFENAIGLPELYRETITYSTHDVSRGLIFPFNTSLWSLFFELVASLAFISLFKWSSKALFLCCLTCLSAWMAYGIIQQHGAGYFNFGLGWGDENFLAGFPRVLYGFCLGMLLYKIYTHAKHEQFSKFFCHFNKAGTFLFYIGFIAILAFPYGLFGFYHIFIIVLVAPVLIFLAACYDCSSNLEIKIAQALGWLSYPLYCVHVPVIKAIDYFFETRLPAYQDTILPLATSFAISILVAIALGRLVDEPVRRFWASSDRLKSIKTPVDTRP